MGQTAVILQSNYLPWKGYFDLIHDADVFVFYDEVKYTKNDWRNRNILNAKGGDHWLSIPVSKESVKLRISEVRLPDSSWQKDHFQVILNTYRRAPHFQQIAGFLEDVYLVRKWEYLSELNQFVTIGVSRMLGIQTEFRNSSDFDLEGDRLERLISILKQLHAETYISGPAAKNYISDQAVLFEKAGINLKYKSYGNYPSYKQFREPFLQAVSILDLLAHVSLKDAPSYIWGWRTEQRSESEVLPGIENSI